ncbi:hypothetical protein CMI37_11670 [Candidatus Pacearchaeota archaeon]|nr:hypothetical protein [Candidatus Pacearchaeota archaeon]|tara:strand:- start:17696 stop:17947 length:252 start_codon:yes stop_codon:yes gene_type:complete
MQKGTIVITLEGLSFEDVEKYRRMIHTLFEQGVFGVRNGSAVLNFGPQGNLNSIEINLKKWRRGDKPVPVAAKLKDVKIEIDT